MLEQKSKIMIERIDTLYDIYNFAFGASENIKSLDVIKEQYLRMYNRIIETEEFDKYEDVEEIILAKIYKIELDLKKSIYMNSKTNSIKEIGSYIISQKEANSTNFEDT